MIIKLSGDTEPIRRGFSIICGELGFEEDSSGYVVTAVCRPGGVSVRADEKCAEIGYDRPCRFWRGLVLLACILSDRISNSVYVEEHPRIEHTGLLLDVSRNAAPTTRTLKHFLRKIALMGMDELFLNLEDMFPMDAYPKFGYMRGRYTADELREVDCYASLLGIEIIPYVQTLAHLSQVLKWDDFSALRDTEDILLADNEETYGFIDDMLTSLSSIFSSRRINLGMDEAYGLGLGRYLTNHGYRSGKSILQDHLAKVAKLAEKHSLHGMIASDMLFASDGTADYSITLPDNIDLMYWDYDRTDSSEIAELIRRHKAWGKKPMYLGTVRTWESFSTAYERSFRNTEAAINACATEHLDEVVTSVWMNDGAENSLFAAMPGISYFSQQVYAPESDAETFRKLFKFQTGADFDAFMLLGEIDEVAEKKPTTGNASKYLLWQDPLLGLFDSYVEGKDIRGHYSTLANLLKEASDRMGPYSELGRMMCELCEVLASKADLGVRIRQAYLNEDREVLADISTREIPALIDNVESLRIYARDLWIHSLKPFGFEIPDGRFGALKARLSSSSSRIDDYLSGRVGAIDELEEPRLPFCAVKGKDMPNVLTYDRIFSVGHKYGPTR